MSNPNAEIARNFLAPSTATTGTSCAVLTDDYVMQFPGQPNLDKEAFVQFAWAGTPPSLTSRTTSRRPSAKTTASPSGSSSEALTSVSSWACPPPAASISMNSLGIGTVRDGRVSKLWALPDVMGMMQQLGAIPEPATA